MNPANYLSLLLVASLVAVMIGISLADDEGLATSSTQKPIGDTYFGVDANDQQAVRQKQEELNREKWQQLFGDANIDDVDFTPDFDSDLIPQVENKLKSLFQLIFKAGQQKKAVSSTTQATV